MIIFLFFASIGINIIFILFAIYRFAFEFSRNNVAGMIIIAFVLLLSLIALLMIFLNINQERKKSVFYPF